MSTEIFLRPCYASMRNIYINQADVEKRSRLRREFIHAVDVLKWIYKLSLTKPSFELQVAGLFHDSERWTSIHKSLGYNCNRTELEYINYKKLHAQRSASFADQELVNRDISPESRMRIMFLIEHHDDTGEEIANIGDPELNLLVAADSFSYFTSIAPDMLAREGPERVRDKVRFMIEKMPQSLRQFLVKQQISDPQIEDIKSAVLGEFEL